MGDDVIPPEFLEPEGDAESQDPDLVLETTTATLRALWKEWMCGRGDGTFVDVEFFGRRIGGVPTPAVDAYRALELALRSAGYEPGSRWAYNCRLIEGTDQPSLHSAGIAVDIDPEENPYSAGDPFAGKIGPDHVAAALAIRNAAGARVWSWGGHWSTPDRMHFQLDRGPAAVDVDRRTVPGVDAEGPESGAVEVKEDEMVLAKGMKNPAVKRFQQCLLVWDPKALPNDGADGVFGKETVDWVGRFQDAFGLEKTGKIDGVTAALLVVQGK
jgi:D-alanyl-D-alanine carboxypeptidase/Putative peptidoglycan binding domain